jgi:hypothetical protein
VVAVAVYTVFGLKPLTKRGIARKIRNVLDE